MLKLFDNKGGFKCFPTNTQLHPAFVFMSRPPSQVDDQRSRIVKIVPAPRGVRSLDCFQALHLRKLSRMISGINLQAKCAAV